MGITRVGNRNMRYGPNGNVNRNMRYGPNGNGNKVQGMGITYFMNVKKFQEWLRHISC